MSIPSLTRPGEVPLLYIVKGDTFSRELRIRYCGAAVDISGCTAAAQIRSWPDGYLIAEMDVTVTDAVQGIITIGLTAANTRVEYRKATWDLELTQGVTVTTLVSGKIEFLEDSTR